MVQWSQPHAVFYKIVLLDIRYAVGVVVVFLILPVILWWTFTFCHGKSPFLMGKSNISMAIFDRFLYVHQRVYPINIPLNPFKSHQTTIFLWFFLWFSIAMLVHQRVSWPYPSYPHLAVPSQGSCCVAVRGVGADQGPLRSRVIPASCETGTPQEGFHSHGTHGALRWMVDLCWFHGKSHP